MKARRLFKSLDDDETGQISFKEILNHTKDCGFPVFLPVVPVRGEAEVALGVCYKTFLLHRTCMRRAPARPMRACLIAVQELDLRAAPVQCNAKQTLSSRVTRRTALFTPRTPHFTLALHTPHFISSQIM
jgi:hypothetical protein